MAKKAKTVFVCQECGGESEKWMGKCPFCGAWNSFVEEKLPEPEEGDARRRGSAKRAGATSARPVRLSEVRSLQTERIDTGIGELNRVLGGGLVKGSLTLISGEPGIGKSTIIIQAAANIASSVGPVLYVSGEESEEQIKMRADRVCKKTDDLLLLAETHMETVLALCEQMRPALLIVDSIQTMYSDGLEGIAGSVSQVRACGNLLMDLGKGLGIPVFIVAHVTKSGELAGPKIVEHLVDTVLQFAGERTSDLRILRALKNRFGTTSEIGAFEMREEGLVEVENLSKMFLEGFSSESEGAVATAVYEGTRPLLLEVQALTQTTAMGFARRSSVGVDASRLAMIVAVLERKAQVNLINRDVYVNIVGGLKPEGTSTDLAVALAIWSAEKGVRMPARMLAFGEIGLTGELRPVQNAEKLMLEAARMGFETVLLPKRNLQRLSRPDTGVKAVGVTTLREALEFLR